MKHESSKHVDSQSNKKEAKLTNTSQKFTTGPTRINHDILPYTKDKG